MSNQEEWDIIELEGDDGEPIRLCVERYFFYNGDEYVLLSDACDVEDEADISRYVMKVQPMEGEGNEDMEEFVPVDEDLMDQLIQVVEATFDTEDEKKKKKPGLGPWLPRVYFTAARQPEGRAGKQNP